MLAGCCFALGYGITHRVLTVQGNAEEPVPEAFEPVGFPGDSLGTLRSMYGNDDQLLEVDLAALEVEAAARRKAKQEAAKLAEEARRAELALQAPEPPAWVAPTFPEPELPKPEPALNIAPSLEPAVVPAALPQPAVLLTPEPPAEPTNVVPMVEPPVLVVEPELFIPLEPEPMPAPEPELIAPMPPLIAPPLP